MKFNINAYSQNTCMHCKTKEEAKDFLSVLHKLGKTWWNNIPYTERTCFSAGRGGNGVLYYFHKGTWATFEYRHEDQVILEWSDFMGDKSLTKSDLKTGDVCLYRNNETVIYNASLDMFITHNGGWHDGNDVNDDLTSKVNTKYDIVAIRRPVRKCDCIFDAFVCNFGDLVYERNEPEEMTLEEVCRLLGKEIKIVKSKEAK